MPRIYFGKTKCPCVIKRCEWTVEACMYYSSVVMIAQGGSSWAGVEVINGVDNYFWAACLFLTL